MKKLLLFLTSFFFICNLCAQDAIMVNEDAVIETSGTIDPALRNSDGIIQEGRAFPSHGTIKIPIVFVRFADDNNTTTNWPTASSLPNWARNFVDPSIPTNNIYQNNNLSKFYDLSSGGNGNGTLGEFQLIGDVFYVTLSHNRSYYELSDGKDAVVSEEVLNILDNPSGYDVDFTDYDHWDFVVDEEAFKHACGTPDGKLDYILIIWKDISISLNSNTGGYSSLRFTGTITKDGIDITKHSGAFSYDAQNKGNENTIWICAHEIGHDQFGSSNISHNHFNDLYNNIGDISKFGLMTLSEGHQFSAYERYRLGWLDPIFVSSNSPSIVLNDTHKSSTIMLLLFL